MHEKTVLQNFDYVFSTGSYLDSMHVEGTVLNAFTMKPEKDITIALYDRNSTDSVVYKSKPLYFTRTNANGQYAIGYLPVSKFKTYAFADKNKNLLYDSEKELFAFKEEPLDLVKDTMMNFLVFNELPSKRYVKKAISPMYGLAYVIYNKEVWNKVKGLGGYTEGQIYSEESRNDTCLIYYRGIYDTLRIALQHGGLNDADTVNIVLSSRNQFEKQKKEGKLKLSLDMGPTFGGKLNYFMQPRLFFNSWMDAKRTDSTKVIFKSKADSSVKVGLGVATLSVNCLEIEAHLEQNGEYQFIFLKGAFQDVNGIMNDSMQFKTKISVKEDYANLVLKLVFPSKENFIVQLTDKRDFVMAEKFVELSVSGSSERNIDFLNLPPGEFYVKIIEDKNKNKIWDTGNLFDKKQPERVFINQQAIKLMADWDSEIEWKIK
jgi:5-hydroxyisourate hydrolase-like protein (transthyretin family)